MLRSCVSVLIACLGILFAATSVYAESVTVRVPADAPTDLPAVIGIRRDLGGASPRASGACDRLMAGGAVPAGTPAEFVPDLDASGKPLGRGTVWLPITIRPDDRGKRLTITLSPVSSRAPGPVRLNVLPDQATEFFDGTRMVLRYNHGPRDLDGRADPNAVVGFIHPLCGLDGETFTQYAPGDHLHHRGLFWAWPRLRRGEQTLGNWWERKDMRYRLGRIIRRESGPVLATLTAEGFWDYQTKDMATPERVVREVVTLRVFGGAFTASADYQAIDVDLDLYALVDGLTMAGTPVLNKGYGGFTLRWPAPRTVRVVADGKPFAKDGVLTRALWADASGDFPGATKDGRSGVAILTSPTHPDSPPPWLLRLYGVLNVSYPGLEFVALHKDKPLRLCYRVIVHRGTAEQARIADLYALYATTWDAKSESRRSD